ISGGLESGDWSGLRPLYPALRQWLKRRAPRGGAWSRLRYLAGEVLRKLQRIAVPTGICVVLLGPDGCGKSALGDGLMEALAPAFRRTARFHLRPNLGRKRRPGVPATEPYGKQPRGAFLSCVKLGYLLFDYVAGYWLTVR